MDMQKLYKFTTAQYGLESLVFKRLKISEFKELNDPYDLKPVIINDDKAKKLHEFIDEKGKTLGLISFSDCWRNPVLWAHYSENHGGIALGFEVAKSSLFRICYENNMLSFPPIQDKFDQEFLEKILTTKFSDWKYEKEWRIFCNLNPANKSYAIKEGKFYFEEYSETIKLKEVILGCKYNLSISKFQQLQKFAGCNVDVFKAKVSSNGFMMEKEKISEEYFKNANP